MTKELVKTNIYARGLAFLKKVLKGGTKMFEKWNKKDSLKA